CGRFVAAPPRRSPPNTGVALRYRGSGGWPFMKGTTKILLIFLTTTSAALPWGANGHRIVGRVAENHLSKRAALQIKTLMGHETVAEASTWPDDVRSDPAWKQAAPWHYVSIDDGETYETTQKNPGGDVIVKMQDFEKALRDPKASPQDKVVALRFLVHFVGDVHQPLHVGRRADQGGNGTKVTWFRNPTNLHAVWDYQIIDAQQLSFSEFAQFLDHP